MKYRLLLRLLRVLIYIKRLFWWLGARIYFVLGKIARWIAFPIIYLRYKLGYFLRKIGLTNVGEWVYKRSFWQLIVFIFMFVIGFSHTVWFPKSGLSQSGQGALAYTLLGGSAEVNIEDVVVAQPTAATPAATPSWKVGTLSGAITPGGPAPAPIGIVGTAAGGLAVGAPIIIGGEATPGGVREQITQYEVQPGDSLSSIAYNFGVSIPTIMWQNKLTLRSIIRPGDRLDILPVTGVLHTIKKRDTIKKIAVLYGADAANIIKFNRLQGDGSNLIVGEKIMIPDGVKPKDQAIVRAVRAARSNSFATQVALPPSADYAVSDAGFLWPTASHMITQYFGWQHHAIDIAGPWQTPNYAARAGTVEVSQCGWNQGYGCYIIVDHGDGLKTLYGHQSKLLVSPGEHVEAGQPIGLMGNTGHVRGLTGIHLHFEIIIDGARVNPLGYVR